MAISGREDNSTAQWAVRGSFLPKQDWLNYSELYVQVCSRCQQGPLQVSNMFGWHLCLVCDNPVLEGLSHIAQQRTLVGNISWVAYRETAWGASPTYPTPCFKFLLWDVGTILGLKQLLLWMGTNSKSPPQGVFWHWPPCLKLQTLLQTLTCILPHLCFIFHLVLITIWHTTCFTYSSFIVFPPPLDFKVYESSNFCLFCSWLYPQYLGKYLACSKCSINVQGWMLLKWLADRSWKMAYLIPALYRCFSKV